MLKKVGMVIVCLSCAVMLCRGGVRHALSTVLTPEIPPVDIPTPSMQPILSSLDLGLSAVMATRGIGTLGVLSPALTIQCLDRGAIDALVSGLPLPVTDCVEKFDTDGDGIKDTEALKNSSINLSIVNDGFDLTLKHHMRLARISDGLLLHETTSNATAAGNIEQNAICQGHDIPTATSVVINGVWSRKVDENADDIMDAEGGGSIEDFAAKVSISEVDPSSCEPMQFIMSGFGKLAYTDTLDSNASFELDILSNTPVTITWETVAGGANVEVNGNYTLSSACFTGSLHLETIESLFFPMSEDEKSSACPVAGVLSVTGDRIETMTYTASGGVEIDQGSDGTIDESFENCRAARPCR